MLSLICVAYFAVAWESASLLKYFRNIFFIDHPITAKLSEIIQALIVII